MRIQQLLLSALLLSFISAAASSDKHAVTQGGNRQTLQVQTSVPAPVPVQLISSEGDRAREAELAKKANQQHAEDFAVQTRAADAAARSADIAEEQTRYSLVQMIASIFGGLLLFWTLRETRRAAEATATAAKAAVASATTEAGLALPHLVLSHMDFSGMGAASYEAMLQFPKIEVAVKNYGGSPAFLMSTALEVAVGHALPSEPDYSRTAIDLPPEIVVESRNDHFIGVARPPDLVPIDDVQAIKTHQKFLWVFGYVVYKDLWGRKHILRFCKQLSPNRLVEESYSFVEAIAPISYTESGVDTSRVLP